MAPLGDRALTIRLGHTVDATLAARANALASHLRRASLPAVSEVVPGYATVTVFYDPTVATYEALSATLAPLCIDAPAKLETPREHVIPVVYDGPDLAEVARRTGLAPTDVIARHVDRTYTAYVVGFVPGFAYLGELDPSLSLPRRDQPRPRVPAGSVAIAGQQTAVYPLATPGGWHLIGHTRLTLFDATADPPALLAAGDRVRFVSANE